jgi:hypothetical protein
VLKIYLLTGCSGQQSPPAVLTWKAQSFEPGFAQKNSAQCVLIANENELLAWALRSVVLSLPFLFWTAEKQTVIPGPAPDFAAAQPAVKTAVPDPAVARNPMTACRHLDARPVRRPAR